MFNLCPVIVLGHALRHGNSYSWIPRFVCSQFYIYIVSDGAYRYCVNEINFCQRWIELNKIELNIFRPRFKRWRPNSTMTHVFWGDGSELIMTTAPEYTLPVFSNDAPVHNMRQHRCCLTCCRVAAKTRLYHTLSLLALQLKNKYWKKCVSIGGSLQQVNTPPQKTLPSGITACPRPTTYKCFSPWMYLSTTGLDK